MTERSSGKLSVARGLAFVALGTVVLALVAEGAASALLALREARSDREAASSSALSEEKHSEYDSELGWMHRPNLRLEGLYGAGTVFTTNSQRLRATRDYGREVPADTYRVVCLGDSFTMGYGVDDSQTFPALLDARPGLEAINMGMGGYGIDQDYLWYLREGPKFDCDLLLFSVIADDFRRTRTALFQGTHPKPLLELSGDRLEVRNVPVPARTAEPPRPALISTLAERLAIGRLFARSESTQASRSEQSPAFEPLAEHLFGALHELSRARGQQFAIAFLPTAGQLQRGETPLAAWLREFSAEAGIEFIDLTPEFDPLPPEQVAGHFTQGHYSARGNALVAQALARFIDELRED